jgi:FixJ family two-component response regulator
MNAHDKHLISLVSVVDDDLAIREATTSLLKSNGFRTQVFQSAEEFLGSPYLPETKCLILDVQMPGMSGLELQRQLIDRGRRMPIIFISAHESLEIRKEVVRAGAVAFLGKPFSEEALLQAIRQGLQTAN